MDNSGGGKPYSDEENFESDSDSGQDQDIMVGGNFNANQFVVGKGPSVVEGLIQRALIQNERVLRIS